MYNKEKQWTISFIYVKTFTYLTIWGPILVHIFFWVMLGPYIKSMGTRGTKMSANADLITVVTLCTTRGNNLKTKM